MFIRPGAPGQEGGDVRQLVLSERDLAVVQTVKNLHYASTRHVRRLVFRDVASNTPCYRSLQRLTNLGYLRDSKIFPPGGSKGGSFHYVYRVTRLGHELFSAAPFEPFRKNLSHTLAVADCVVVLDELHRSGMVLLVGYDTEPNSHTRVGGVDLRPDIYCHLVHPHYGTLKLWVEVDLDTEGPRQIMGKLNLYRAAYYRYDSQVDGTRWPEIPRVLWVAVDTATSDADERMDKLQRYIEDLPEGDRHLFRVTTLAELPTILTG